MRGIDEVVPGIERPGLVRYRLRGSIVAPDQRPANLVAVRTVDTDGHDAARHLVTDVHDRIAGPPLPQGLVAAHFHISTDGTRVLLYEEWTDAESATTSTHHTEPLTPSNLYHLHRSLTRVS
ncbi:hypothetical protein GCM10011581_46430 [Saccharopolyspora subtropica]|uniref:Antibiotic biosynthesis monooxygenase n=1 Tax=Saccharopolyspora thermophila TaxID=89367 RepID=A0A917K9X6_9PSEU|nr:hypothetical protein GCM10011581_46430 [Saccharopolyspora subtropica]